SQHTSNKCRMNIKLIKCEWFNEWKTIHPPIYISYGGCQTTALLHPDHKQEKGNELHPVEGVGDVRVHLRVDVLDGDLEAGGVLEDFGEIKNKVKIYLNNIFIYNLKHQAVYMDLSLLELRRILTGSGVYQDICFMGDLDCDPQNLPLYIGRTNEFFFTAPQLATIARWQEDISLCIQKSITITWMEKLLKSVRIQICYGSKNPNWICPRKILSMFVIGAAQQIKFSDIKTTSFVIKKQHVEFSGGGAGGSCF
ncbi:hypothetical protein ACJX0J_011755, partial [Zea mays]